MQPYEVFSASTFVIETRFQDCVYSVFATVIRIPDVNFTIEKKNISPILIHLIVHDPLNLIQDLIHHKFWYTCVRVSKYVSKYLIQMQYVSKYVPFFDTYYNMYNFF